MSNDTIIQEDGFGFLDHQIFNINEEKKSPEIVRRYIMTNKNKASVRLISLGAGIQSIRIPNKKNHFGDVVLGFDDTRGYLQNRYIGRVINSVDDKSLNGNEKNSDRSNKKLNNFDLINWQSCVSGQRVIMSHVGEFWNEDRKKSGNISIQAKYNWNDDNELNINIRATVTQSFPANLTVFCPMNLAGHGTGSKELKNHIVTINSDYFFATKPGENWSNRICKVDETFFDLRSPKKLKNQLIRIPGGGYNHNMRINTPSNWCYRFHGRILHPDSGRFLEIYSNKANLRFSTFNDFPNLECENSSETFPEKKNGDENFEIRGKDEAFYGRHDAFVFSPQNYANENVPNFPNCLLHPSQIFLHDLSFKFGTK